MKKLFLAYILGVLALTSCDYGDGWDGYKEELVGGPIAMVTVSPSTGLLYKDSNLPVLSYYVAPLGAKDTTVTWSSDKPEVLNVDPVTGVLSWGSPVNTEVVIAATSNSNPEIKGSCIFTVRNANGRYRYVDARKQAGLWILDRNLGATTQPVEGAIPTLNNTWTGNFYQYGKNAPVANYEVGGPDGKGGYLEFTYNGATKKLIGGYPTYVPYWDNTMEGFVDWTDPKLVLDGMDGWRLPTKEELEKLAYWMDENNFRTAAEKGAAKYFMQELGFGPGGLIGGEKYNWIFDMGDATELYSSYIWSSSYNPDTQKAWVLRIRDGRPSVIELSTVGIACPIRLVRDAADFGGE